MKASTLVILIAELLAGNALAQTTPPEKDQPPIAKPSAGAMNMESNMARMHEQMKKTQALMDRMRKTTDPTERQKLIQDHMQSMREGMSMMQGMGGAMLGGKGGMGMMGGDPKQRQDMMERRMDMMQMMMDQMMQHQQMSQPTQSK